MVKISGNSHLRIIPIVFLVFVVSVFAGCGSPPPSPKTVIIQTQGNSDFSFSLGVIYKVTAMVRNDGDSGTITLKAEIIADETGQVRDSTTETIHLNSGEQLNVQFDILDGESGESYTYSVEIVSQVADSQ